MVHAAVAVVEAVAEAEATDEIESEGTLSVNLPRNEIRANGVKLASVIMVRKKIISALISNSNQPWGVCPP